jgi:hypothetical protein
LSLETIHVGSSYRSKADEADTRVPSVACTASSTMLAREINIRMNDTHVPGESVAPGEGLLLVAKRTPDFLLADVVDRVFVSSEIIRTSENGVARLPRRRIGSLTLVRACLRVSLHEFGSGHARAHTRGDVGGSSVNITLVLLELLRIDETLSTAMVRTAVCAGVGR